MNSERERERGGQKKKKTKVEEKNEKKISKSKKSKRNSTLRIGLEQGTETPPEVEVSHLHSEVMKDKAGAPLTELSAQLIRLNIVRIVNWLSLMQ